MITYIDKKDAQMVNKYSILFEEATKALQTHDINGASEDNPDFLGAALSSDAPSYVEVSLTAKDFIPTVYYIKDDSGVFHATTLVDKFQDNVQYYEQILPDSAITSIDEYFANIATLSKIDRKFTILPINEEVFEIDANTRQITIPASFAKNGLSVQGDESAEIVYFKIRRYYDMTDLAEQKCIIQWRAPEDENKVRREGVSVPWVIDLETYPGFLLIGWPLSTEITEHSGKVDFSVRFYGFEEETKSVYYSFTTLTAQADIKTSLVYNIAEVVNDKKAYVDSSRIIEERIVNSTISDKTTPDPEEPEILDDENFVLRFESGAAVPESRYKAVEDEISAKKVNYEVYLTNPDTGLEDAMVYCVQAYSPDGGVISYAWRKDDVEGVYDPNFESVPAWYKVDDQERNPHKIYYIKTDEGIFKPYTFEEDETLTDVEAKGITLYERFSAYHINNVNDENKSILGDAYPIITNRVGRKIKKIFGSSIILRESTDPVIEQDIPETGIFAVDEDHSFSFALGTKVDDKAYVKCELFRKNADGDFVSVADSTPETENKDLYEVKKDGKVSINGKDYDGTETIDVNDGYYKLAVYTRLNGSEKSVESRAIRLTNPAANVKIANSDPAFATINGYDINQDIWVKAMLDKRELAIREDSDSIEFKWYRYNTKADATKKNEDIERAQNGKYEVSESDVLLGEENIKVEVAAVDGGEAYVATARIVNTAGNDNSLYFCQVINTVNGSSSYTCSPFFNVIDSEA